MTRRKQRTHTPADIDERRSAPKEEARPRCEWLDCPEAGTVVPDGTDGHLCELHAEVLYVIADRPILLQELEQIAYGHGRAAL